MVPLFAALARLAREARDAFETKSDTVLGAALTVLTRPGGDGEVSVQVQSLELDTDFDPMFRPSRTKKCLGSRTISCRS